MFKTFLQFLALKSIADMAAFTAKEETEKEALYKEYNELLKSDFEAQVEKMVSKEDLETAVKSNDPQAIKTALDELEKKFNAFSEEAKSADKPLTLQKALSEKMDSIKALAQKVGSETELIIKADTIRASITDNDQAVDLNTIGQLATRRLSMYDLFPKVPVSVGNHNGTIRYYDWDEDTTARAADMIAETGTFPESTAKWKGYTLDLKKIGDTLPVSAEFYEDAAMFAAELEMFLKINVDLVCDNQIANGDGTGNQLTGLFASVPAFNSALVSTVPNATFYDLLAVSTEQITISGGAKYQPNFVVMRKSMINQMRLTKDTQENYIIPPFVSRDGREVDGMIVIESNIIPDNQLVLGDRNFGRIYEMSGLTFARGTVNAQFAEDMETLKVRKRIAFLIRTVDQTGFIKITDVTAAIAAITAT